MAQSGDRFVHPTGAQIMVGSWNGEAEATLIYDIVIPGHGGALPEHVHHDRVERYDVRRGVARYRLHGEEKALHAGEYIVIPEGAPHVNPWNDQDEELVVQATIVPARDTEAAWMRIGFTRAE